MKIQHAIKLFCFLAVILCGFSLAPDFSFAANVKNFFGNGTPGRDGSIYPGGPCTGCVQDKDGSIFPGGECINCATTCCDKPSKKPLVKNYEVAYDDEIYTSVYRDCKNFAPITLEYVDFRIKKEKKFEPFSTKLGQYRFRIFGCRRFDKEAILNQGRIMQKDMKFIPIFNQTVGSCYPIINMPSDLCLETSPQPLPEYILTAEITDYYMNLCDGYDWDTSNKEDRRTGSSEMTVTWRLMDITKSNVYWKGTSTGYGEIEEGTYNAEVLLVENAFADAVSNLRNLPGFENQLASRVPPKELEAERQALIEVERVSDPVKCQFETEIQQTLMAEKTDCPACNICTLTPGALDSEGKLIPLCENVTLVQEVLELPADNINSQLVVPGETIILDTVNVVEAPVMEISENSGFVSNSGLSKDQHALNETLMLPPETGSIEENSGINIDGTGVNESGGLTSGSEFEKAKPEILDAGDSISTGSSGNSNSAFNEGAMNEKDNVAIVDDSWIDIASSRRSAAENGFYDSQSSLCIIDRDPYTKLTPQDLYKVRTSIVGITNSAGKRGAGLIVSDQFVLTSADLIIKENNHYDLQTINGGKLKASAFRINPSKNTALLLLDEKTNYTPLSLNLKLPEVGQSGFMALGLLDVDDSFENGEGYIDNNGTVSGYRYSKEKGAEIIIDTFVQTVTVGGALIDEHGTINGLAHSGKKNDESPDLFIPTETALRSLGLSICEKTFENKSPWQKYKTLTEAIKYNSGNKEPGIMKAKERK